MTDQETQKEYEKLLASKNKKKYKGIEQFLFFAKNSPEFATVFPPEEEISKLNVLCKTDEGEIIIEFQLVKENSFDNEAVLDAGQ